MPVVVLTKADVATPTPELLEERLALLADAFRHVEVFAVNAMDACRHGRCAAILGADRPWCCWLLGGRQIDADQYVARRRGAGHRRRAHA
jgi:hypothetical protein